MNNYAEIKVNKTKEEINLLRSNYFQSYHSIQNPQNSARCLKKLSSEVKRDESISLKIFEIKIFTISKC